MKTGHIVTLFVLVINLTISLQAQLLRSDDFDTLVVASIDLSDVRMEGNINLKTDKDSGTYLYVPTGSQGGDKVTCSFEITEKGLYEVKLRLSSDFYHAHWPDTAADTTLHLDDEVRTWPMRSNTPWRYRNVPAVFELEPGEHTLTIENIHPGIKVGDIKLVYDKILTAERMDEEPPFDMPEVKVPVFADRNFDVTDYGAKQCNQESMSAAIKKAIAACAEAGGGTVNIPAGQWHTGPIHFKSNVRINIDKHADVFFSDDPNNYLPAVFVRWAGVEMYNYSPLIYAINCENIALTGEGRLIGNGKSWWKWKKDDQEAMDKLYDKWVINFEPVEKRNGVESGHVFRPQFFEPVNCKNVLIEDVTFESGPFWTVNVVYCENVTIRRIKIGTRGPNGDGVCPNSSKNVIIEHCLFMTEDDSVAIHTGLNDDGRRVNKPTENVVIRHNRFSGGYWGGCSIGSLTTGGVRNIFYYDNHHADINHSFYFKSTRGRGGVVENIHIANSEIRRMSHNVFEFTMFYKSWFGSEHGSVPTFRDIVIRNIKADNSKSCFKVQGLPERPLENIVFENVKFTNSNSGEMIDVRDVIAKNLYIESINGQALTLTNCRNMIFDNPAFKGCDGIDLQIKGKHSSNIAIVNAADELDIQCTDGARKGAVNYYKSSNYSWSNQ